MDGVNLSPELFQYLHLERIPYAVLWLLAAVVLVRFVTTTTDRLGDRFANRRLLLKQIAAVARFTVFVSFAGIATTTVVELTDQALLAISGTAAVAIAFAIRDLLASLIAGIILLFDRPFQVGDRVQFGSTYGEVQEMGLRSVRIATLDDNLVSVPNNLFLTSAVSSANAGALDQMCVFDYYIGCNEDFDAARRIVYEATAASRYVYLNKPISMVVREGPVPNGAERFAILIRVKAYVLDGRYETAFGTDVTERVLRSFRKLDIRTAGQIEWGPPETTAHVQGPGHGHPEVERDA
jgi:small-conductance mechanosensitive channel